MKYLILAALLICLVSPAYSFSLNLTVSQEVRVWDQLKVLMILSNTTSTENVTGQACVFYILDENNNTVAGSLVAYDSILNEPPSMKTNAGGRAYYSLGLSNDYSAYDNHTVVADCAGATSQSTFYVLPAAQTDQIANLLFSAKTGGYAWLALGLFLIFVVAAVFWVGKAIF